MVGGGPSGTAAAAAAAHAGADVALLERYNHLGGLSTGGLVIWIDRMTDWEGKLVIRGFAEEEERRAHKEYRQKLKAEGGFGTLGDLLKQRLAGGAKHDES